jgi:hypothetical protein
MAIKQLLGEITSSDLVKNQEMSSYELVVKLNTAA